ncbi:MAG: Rdx family protein [Anaerolineae bacterium]|nr:Rdx family protein [Anaerolineae bacterium]
MSPTGLRQRVEQCAKFEVWVDETHLWSRAEAGRFPDITELKQRVRDQVAPEKSLGTPTVSKTNPFSVIPISRPDEK